LMNIGHVTMTERSTRLSGGTNWRRWYCYCGRWLEWSHIRRWNVWRKESRWRHGKWTEGTTFCDSIHSFVVRGLLLLRNRFRKFAVVTVLAVVFHLLQHHLSHLAPPLGRGFLFLVQLLQDVFGLVRRFPRRHVFQHCTISNNVYSVCSGDRTRPSHARGG